MNIFPLIAIGSGSINQNGDLLDVRYHLIVNKENQELHNKLEFNYGSYNNLESLLSSTCLLYTSPSPRDRQKSRMPSSA